MQYFNAIHLMVSAPVPSTQIHMIPRQRKTLESTFRKLHNRLNQIHNIFQSRHFTALEILSSVKKPQFSKHILLAKICPQYIYGKVYCQRTKFMQIKGTIRIDEFTRWTRDGVLVLSIMVQERCG